MASPGFDPAQLRSLRKSKQVTAVNLAGRMGISPAQVHRLEKGLRRLTVDNLLSYCDALGVSASSLLVANVRVPLSGIIDSDFQVQPLPEGTAARTVAPPLSADMSTVYALRWAASRRFAPMRDHLVYYRQLTTDQVPDIAWNKRCLVVREDGRRCLGWPVRNDSGAHIDVGSGPVEFDVKIAWAAPVIAVMPPHAVEELERSPTRTANGSTFEGEKPSY